MRRTLIYILLDGNAPLGHHTFCDSENNGPRASALVEEFIFVFEKKFRARDEAMMIVLSCLRPDGA
jgi:hypothetical protein